MSTFLSNPGLQRLGITVFHALWELTFLSLVAWCGLFLLRRRAPQTRYLWACCSLAAMVVAPVFTFLAVGPFPGPGLFLSAGFDGGMLLAAPLQGDAKILVMARALAPWLALLWSAGTALMALRLGGGLWWLDRAYLAQAVPASKDWQTRLDRLASRLGLSPSVPLLQSRRADTPLVIGWLKPAILVPASVFLNLSPQALEAVLAHELAHVRRGDYLANLLQTLAEALLFFHPAAWWLSGQIRELREHCCDDAASALCGDPVLLAQGLSALERLRRSPHPDPEPALAAAKGILMHRITRLFRPQEASTPSLRGLALVLIGAVLLGTATLAAHQASRPSDTRTQPKVGADGVADLDFSKIKIVQRPPTPAYPAEAKTKGIQGTVIVEIIVDEKGVPESVKALSGPEELQPTVTAYAKEWRFKPAKLHGKPIKARFKLTMPFRLR